jgi:hypothetical protein
MQPADNVIGELIKRLKQIAISKVYLSSEVLNFKENGKKFDAQIKSPDGNEAKTF